MHYPAEVPARLHDGSHPYLNDVGPPYLQFGVVLVLSEDPGLLLWLRLIVF